MNRENEDKGKKAKDSDESQSQQEPDDTPDVNQEKVDEDPGEWTPVGRKRNRSQRGASSSGNRGRESGQRGRGRSGSSQSERGKLIGSKHTQSLSSGSNRGRSQTQSHQSGGGSASHSQRGASSSARESAFDLDDLDLTVNQHFDARIPTQDMVNIQRTFKNTINAESQGNYLSVTGFRFKKWMYADCDRNYTTQQTTVYVSYRKRYYSIDTKDGWCKVNAIVFPELVLNNSMEEEILNQNIYGCFLYIKPVKLFDNGRNVLGKLLYTLNMNTDRQRGVNRGFLCGVYPHYMSGKYYTWLCINTVTKSKDSYPSRFSPGEAAKGIGHRNNKDALESINFIGHLKKYWTTKATGQNHLWAVYVPKYVSLVVFFTNREVNVTERIRQKQLPNDTPLNNKFHERFLFQCGGGVSFENYPLFFQYMYEKNGKEIEFKDIKTQPAEHPGFGPLKNTMGNVKYPLMVLGIPNDPTVGKQPHFAGYFLEIKNYENPPKAILRIPSNGGISEVHEMGSKRNQPKTRAWTFLNEGWNNKSTHKVCTGPWDDTQPDNDGSKWEAFYNSEDQYLAPTQ